jgi:hypothetical protein
MARNFSPTFKGNFENYKPHHTVERTIGKYSVNDANALKLLLFFSFVHLLSQFDFETIEPNLGITDKLGVTWELQNSSKSVNAKIGIAAASIVSQTCHHHLSSYTWSY